MTEILTVSDARRRTSSEGSLECPSCGADSFDCEACLHQHLLTTHGVRYSQVFGHTPGEWSQPCPSSNAGSVLGL